MKTEYTEQIEVSRLGDRRGMKQEWTYEEYVARTTPSLFAKFWRKSLSRIARLTIVPQLRILCYRITGMHIGKGVFIGPDCYLDDTFPELISRMVL